MADVLRSPFSDSFSFVEIIISFHRICLYIPINKSAVGHVMAKRAIGDTTSSKHDPGLSRMHALPGRILFEICIALKCFLIKDARIQTAASLWMLSM